MVLDRLLYEFNPKNDMDGHVFDEDESPAARIEDLKVLGFNYFKSLARGYFVGASLGAVGGLINSAVNDSDLFEEVVVGSIIGSAVVSTVDVAQYGIRYAVKEYKRLFH